MKPVLLLVAGLTAGTILGHLAARASLRWICGHDLLDTRLSADQWRLMDEMENGQ